MRHQIPAVNWSHPLNKSLKGWWLTRAATPKGLQWLDLTQRTHATLSGGALWSASPERAGGQGSVYFDGTDDDASAATVLSGTITDLTVMGWVYRAASNQRAVFGWTETASSRAMMLWNGDGFVYFFLENAGLNFGFYGEPAATGWHHISLIYDGNQALAGDRVRSTFDGVSVAVVPLGTNPATYTVTGSFHIGKEAAESRLATGRADDIRVYDRILTPDEIKAYYDLSLRGYPGLLARSHEFIGKRAAAAAVTTKRFLPLLGVGA